jgi:hypothetical protein
MRSARGAAVGLALALLTLVLACGLSGVAMGQGVVEPPEADVQLGDLRVIADIARVPVCSQMINPGCPGDIPVPPVRIYTIWLLRRTTPGSWDGARMSNLLSYRIGR